jgi:hypothetical protein
MEKSGVIMSTPASIAFSGKVKMSVACIHTAAVALWHRNQRFVSVFQFSTRNPYNPSLRSPNAMDVPTVEILPVSAGARRRFSAPLGGVLNDVGLLLR